MRAWLALLFATAIAANEIALNLPCNKELDGLLASDPEGNQSAFLSCVGVGVGDIGFWERKFCPNRMIFDFVNQQCKEEEKRSRKEPLTKFNIAILNNSCARGEQCIGGTVCDLDTLKCLCPFGTHADLDTLSCVTPQQHNVPSQFSAFNGFKQSPFGSSFMGSESFLPNPNFAMSTPNPVYNFNFNSKPPSTPFGSGISGAPEYFKPNPSVFGGSNSFIPNSGGSKPTTLVGVGALCNDLAECDHGSSCVMGRCVCVTPLILQDGICVMQQQVKHVGPGELCDNGELCIRGSVCDTLIPVCVCPPETDLRDGECIRVGHYIPPTPQVYPWVTQSPQPVPTEPSTQNTGYQNNYGQSEQQQQQISNFNNNQNNNQQPNRPQVPVIPYPRQPQTSQQSLAVSPANQPYQPPRTPVTVQTIETPFQPYQTAAPPTQRPPQPPQPPIRTQPPPIRTQPPTRPYTPTYETQTPTRRPLNIPTTTPQSYRSINNPSPPNVKPNIVKLGGSKQSGVGVRCALNTDCMIGAYCNGNTNPPTCQCLSTHVNVDSRCEKVIYPGQAGCQSDSQCSAAYTGTSCIDRVCICPAGNKAVDQTCVPVNEVITSPPGGSCSDERECTGGSVCREGWCICPHHTMIVQKGICVQTQVRPTVPPKVAPVEHHTYTTKQIYTNPPTQPPTTRTPPQTQRPMQLPTKQGRKATPGSKCGPLDVCVGGSMCVEGMCLCPAGSRASDNGRCEAAAATTARPTAAPGEHRTRPVTHSPQQPRRPTPASIEVTLTPNPGQSDLDYDDSECRAVGLICRGNTICVNRSCQCPVGHLLLGDACVPPGQAISRNKANRKGKSWSQAGSASAKYSRPGEDCSEGEMCTGGSHCGEGLQPFTKSCVCPADKPVIRGDFCAAEQTINAGAGQQCSHGVRCIGGSTCVSGWCRCANGMMAFNGECVPRPTSPPTVTVPPTTAQVQTIAPRYSAPHNPCDNGETCTGGSRCDGDTGMCMCHSGQIVMGTQCAYPPTTAPAPKAECSDNSHCRDNRMCVSGRCKCRPGYVDNMGRCDPLEAVEFNERPAPVSYARHKVETLAEEETEDSEATTRMRATPRPRVKGPPIRRPKPKTKSGSSGRSGGGSSGGMSSLKTGNGDGNCPPGNEPTREESSGRIIMCNGIEPNCPPRSYCYITSGGFAAEEYNCCKSW